VASWYAREGYEILARNWRCPRGELDVVAWRNGVLVICEVKARRNNHLGDPFEAITPRKVLRLRRATAMFITASRSGVSKLNFSEVRFDVAAVRGRVMEMRQSVL
jgi:putative endonuclease